MNVAGNTMIWSPGITLESIEKQVILIAFRFFRGNKTQTAQALGIAIRTLDAKLEQYQQDGKHSERLQNELRARHASLADRQRGTPDLIKGGLKPISPEVVFNGGLQPKQGDGVESVKVSIPKLDMPVQVGEKVQEVLPTKAASNRTRKPSKAVPRGNEETGLGVHDSRK
jgi:hypothetical protein